MFADTLNPGLFQIAEAIRSKAAFSEAMAFPEGFLSGLERISGLTPGITADQIATRTIAGNMQGVASKIQNSAFMNTAIYGARFPYCSAIGFRAFAGCSSLISISFPKCTLIGESAFNDCPNLSLAFFNGSTVPTLSGSPGYLTNPFYNTGLYRGIGTIYVLPSLYSDFRQAWSGYVQSQVFQSYYE